MDSENKLSENFFNHWFSWFFSIKTLSFFITCFTAFIAYQTFIRNNNGEIEICTKDNIHKIKTKNALVAQLFFNEGGIFYIGNKMPLLRNTTKYKITGFYCLEHFWTKDILVYPQKLEDGTMSEGIPQDANDLKYDYTPPETILPHNIYLPTYYKLALCNAIGTMVVENDFSYEGCEDTRNLFHLIMAVRSDLIGSDSECVFNNYQQALDSFRGWVKKLAEAYRFTSKEITVIVGDTVITPIKDIEHLDNSKYHFNSIKGL